MRTDFFISRFAGRAFLLGLFLLAIGRFAGAEEEVLKPEVVQKIGTLKQEKSRIDWNRWMGDRILVLVCPEESITLLRGNDKRLLTKMEALVGKRLLVSGIPVSPSPRHPRAGMKVMAFSEAPELASSSIQLQKKDIISILDF